MDEVKLPLAGEALLQKTRENSHLSRRELAQLCGYVEITSTNQIRVRLNDFYDAVLAAQKEKEMSPPILHSLKTSLDREEANSTTKLIKELSMYCGDIKSLNVSTPPLNNPYQSDSDDYIIAKSDRGFFCYPNCVGFETLGSAGSCWVKIYVSSCLELEVDAERAIVVPYFVSKQNYFYLSDDNPGKRIDLDSEQYQLLYQSRYLKDEEIKSLGDTFNYFFDPEFYDPDSDNDDFRPKLCILTFIPTTEEIEPQILRCEPGFDPPSNLIVFKEPMQLS